MIEGLKLSITTEELRKLMKLRVDYHQKRAEKFKVRAEQERTDRDEARQEADEIGKYANSRAMGETAETRMLHHSDRATVFEFMADHLIQNETYVLTEDDLRKLEVMNPRNF